MKYVLEAELKGLQDSKKLHGLISFTHLDQEFTCSNTWVKQFGSENEFNQNTMILLDYNMIKKYPLLKST